MVALVGLTPAGTGCADEGTSPDGTLERPWRVVIVNDADPTLPTFIALDSALRAALGAPGRHRVDVFSESLDSLRFPMAQLEDKLVALMAEKYAGMRVDAIVAIGTTSLDFAEKHRSRLWPDARILYTGVPVELLRDRQLAPATTGIPRRFDLAGTVELALRLRPETRRLIVIAGSGDFDRVMTRLARTQLEPLATRLTIEYWLDAPIDEYVRRIAKLGSDDAVLYLSIGRDAEGRTFAPREVLKELSAASSAPIYSPYETHVGHGIVAGSVYSMEDRGRRMGELVHDVLSRPLGQVLPAPGVGPSSCMADANELKRFGMSENRLPPGCEVRFRAPSLWRDYKWYVVVALLVVALQSALIVAVLLQRRWRHRAEIEASHRRAELAQASRLALAGELTATIAHEINQPLGAILANAGAAERMLRGGAPNDGGLLNILGDIRKDDLRASEIISRVRGLVTRHEIDCEPVDVNPIVEGVVTLLGGEAARREIAVETVLAPGLPVVLADRVQLEQALVNLCVNAMDAMVNTPVQGRRLVLGTRGLADGRVEIFVIDHGPGISAEQLPRLFDSFFTTKADGMGLGLSIARSIVEGHGGTLKAENRRDGGAMFSFDLPARGENRPATDAAPAKTPSDMSV